MGSHKAQYIRIGNDDRESKYVSGKKVKQEARHNGFRMGSHKEQHIWSGNDYRGSKHVSGKKLVKQEAKKVLGSERQNGFRMGSHEAQRIRSGKDDRGSKHGKMPVKQEAKKGSGSERQNGFRMGSHKAQHIRSGKDDTGSKYLRGKRPVKQESKKRKNTSVFEEFNVEKRKKVKTELRADFNVNGTSLLDQKASLIHFPSSSSSKKPLMILSKARKPSRYSFCAICMDTKMASEMFENTKVCRHLYCLDCIRGHVAAKIKENVTKVKCPDPSCKGVIEPQVCRSIVPKQVLERWENILCESVIMESHKFYCPFKDCSAMLVDDGGVAITSSECPHCHRLFCAQCKVAWHCGINCIEYQSLKKGKKSPNDILLMNLAKKKKWMKCPNCKLFVEKTYGCNHISCRCGHQFCYRCGKPDNGSTHICISVV